ncbi:MAG: NTP/NDP exchange transporter [Phycisphaerae bacterium]
MPDGEPRAGGGPGALPLRLLAVKPQERGAVAWAALYFFFVLAAHYVLRPVREAMGISGGADKLAWLFVGTALGSFAVQPLYGALVSAFSRAVFIPLAYRGFSLVLVGFSALLTLSPTSRHVAIGYAFFIFFSVFNVFIVAVFWSVMADRFRPDQGKRLFGLIGAGGTLGAIAGAAATERLAHGLGAAGLPLVSVLLIEAALWCARRVLASARQGDAAPADEPRAAREREAADGGADSTSGGRATSPPRDAEPDEQRALARGGLWGGAARVLRSTYLLGVAAYVVLLSGGATLVYMEQGRVVAAAFASQADRTVFFARLDLWVNMLVLLVQVFLAGRVIPKVGVGVTLALLPMVTLAGFVGLAAAPTLSALFWFQVARRAGEYALARPAREVLYTVLKPDEKYKAKNFVDVFVFRAADVLWAWVDRGLRLLGGSSGALWTGMPLAIAWLVLSALLGRALRARTRGAASPR